VSSENPEETRAERASGNLPASGNAEQRQLRAPIGTHDLLPPESALMEELVASFAQRARRAGYGLLVTPTFEEASLFERGIGDGADVVRKEMYTFQDRQGRKLALKPEGTAPAVRAFLQHHPVTPWKVWYVSSAFRYERPQAGRYREHHQLGVEAFGTADADLDVEVIDLAVGFAKSLGIETRLRINSMGDRECRPAYLELLASYLTSHKHELCEEHQGRISVSPLRILDCKTPQCRQVSAGAPLLKDHLCPACAAHHRRVLSGLDALGIDATEDDHLVRGFDYYTRTTFELSCPALESAQDAVGGGGRYDYLVEELSGPATPAIGFGMGVERLMLAVEAAAGSQGSEETLGSLGSRPRVEVWVVDLVGGEVARDLSHELREAGISTDRSFDGRSLKAQLKAADRSRALLSVIVGTDEQASGLATIRWMRGNRSGSQESVPMTELVSFLSRELSASKDPSSGQASSAVGQTSSAEGRASSAVDADQSGPVA
jgi:histidyl-tRNA synthetase